MRRAITLIEMLHLDEAHVFSVKEFFQRLDAAKELAAHGSTEGEKSAAEAAVKRLIARATAELPNLSPSDRVRLRVGLRMLDSPPPKSAERTADKSASSKPNAPDWTRRYKYIPVADVLPTRKWGEVTLIGPGWAYVTRQGDNRLVIKFHWAASSAPELLSKIRASGFQPDKMVKTAKSQTHWECYFDYAGTNEQVIDVLTRGGFTKSPY